MSTDGNDIGMVSSLGFGNDIIGCDEGCFTIYCECTGCTFSNACAIVERNRNLQENKDQSSASTPVRRMRNGEDRLTAGTKSPSGLVGSPRVTALGGTSGVASSLLTIIIPVAPADPASATLSPNSQVPLSTSAI